jgi:UPF0716 protein FxsA
MPLLFLLFLTVPALELYLLIEIGSYIGALNTVGIVFVTALLGATLLRREGLHTLLHAQQRVAAGEAPARELVEGALLVFAGTLLLTPGFLTDLVGLCCLVPPLRQRIADALLKRMVVQFGQVYAQTQFDSQFQQSVDADIPPRTAHAQRRQPGANHVQGDVIEGEFRRKD